MTLESSSELLEALEADCRCRTDQIWQLLTFYHDIYPSPTTLVVYGIRGSGKLTTVSSVLEARQIQYAIIRSEECLSLRHFLSSIQRACHGSNGQLRQEDSQVESVNALCASLERARRYEDERFVLILDGVDKQRGLHPTTLPALVRLGDRIPKLCLILIASTTRALSLQKTGIPYLHFPPYSRNDSIHLISDGPISLAPPGHLEQHKDSSTLEKWYALFVATVYDSMHFLTSLSVARLREICEQLWPRFIWPYISGEKAVGRGKNSKWDFQKLLVRQRSLLQNTARELQAASLLTKTSSTFSFESLQKQQQQVCEQEEKDGPPMEYDTTTVAHSASRPPSLPGAGSKVQKSFVSRPFLPFFPTLVLAASYLASHTPPKLDILLFSRLSSSSRSARTKKKYHRRKLLQSPSKPKAAAGADDIASTPSQTPTKKKINRTTAKATSSSSSQLAKTTTNIPRPFPLDRLAAIVRSIHPAGVPPNRSIVDRISHCLVELERLRLVIAVGHYHVDGGGVGDNDDDVGRRWRINVSRDFVEKICDAHAHDVTDTVRGAEGLGGQATMDKKIGLRGLIREYELVN